MRQIALQRGVVGAGNATHVACDELGLPGRAGHTFIVNFSQSKTSRTHAAAVEAVEIVVMPSGQAEHAGSPVTVLYVPTAQASHTDSAFRK